jgi:hypothetical protein
MSDYFGLPTLSLKNSHIQVDVLKEAGPRIVRLVPAGTNLNLMAEVPDLCLGPADMPYRVFGGHRLWRAPEVTEITYIHDDKDLKVEEIENGLRLTHDDNGVVHYQRMVEVRLDPNAAKLTLNHSITNLGSAALSVAPWAITMFRMGGRVCLPLTDGVIGGSEFTPNRSLVLWPYTNLGDERLFISNKHV